MARSSLLAKWINSCNFSLERKNLTKGVRNIKSQGLFKPVNPKIKIEIDQNNKVINGVKCNIEIGTILVSILGKDIYYCFLGKQEFISSNNQNIFQLDIEFLEANSKVHILELKKSSFNSLCNKLVFFLHKDGFQTGMEFMTTTPFVFTKANENNPLEPKDFTIPINNCFEFYKQNMNSKLYTCDKQDYTVDNSKPQTIQHTSPFCDDGGSSSAEEEIVACGIFDPDDHTFRNFTFDNQVGELVFLDQSSDTHFQINEPKKNINMNSYQPIESYPPMSFKDLYPPPPPPQPQYNFNVGFFLQYVKNPALIDATDECNIAKTVRKMVGDDSKFLTDINILSRMNKIMKIEE